MKIGDHKTMRQKRRERVREMKRGEKRGKGNKTLNKQKRVK